MFMSRSPAVSRAVHRKIHVRNVKYLALDQALKISSVLTVYQIIQQSHDANYMLFKMILNYILHSRHISASLPPYCPPPHPPTDHSYVSLQQERALIGNQKVPKRNREKKMGKKSVNLLKKKKSNG